MKKLESVINRLLGARISSFVGSFLMLAATGCTMEVSDRDETHEIGTLQQPISGGWTTLTLKNGWAPYPGSATPAIGMVNGVVRLRGAIRIPPGTSQYSAIAFEVPSNFQSPDCLMLRAAMGTSAGGRVAYRCDLFGGQAPYTFHMQINEDGYGSEAEPGPNARAFTSLDGLSFDKDVYDGTPIFLVNGWAATYSYRMGVSGSEGGNAVYFTYVDGSVRLQGHISSGTATRIGTLPSGFRPNATVYLPVTLCDSYGRLVIYTSGNIYVQNGNGGSFSDASCGVSLEGTSFPLPSAVWPLTLQNGWATYSSREAKANMAGGGIVQFEGSISGGTSQTIANLEWWMAPPNTVRVVADSNGAREARLVIDSSGVVKVTGESLTHTSGFTSLEGPSFSF